MSNSKKLFSLLAITPLLCCSCSKQQERSFFAFDTVIQTKYIGDLEAFVDIENTIYQLNDLCDAYNYYQTNNICLINQKVGEQISVDLRLYDLLETAVNYKEKTNNVFNPFIKNVVDEWKKALNNDSLPDLDLINTLNEKALSTRLLFSDSSTRYVGLEGEGKIDVGGIAKGYLLSNIKPIFEKYNITDYIFDAGQSSILLGESSLNEGFYSVGIYETGHSTPSRYLKLKNTSIGTSSIYEQKYVKKDGKTYSHCINGKTGSAEVKNDMVVVLGSDPIMCDVYSTVGMVSTIDEIKEIESSNPIKFLVFSDDQITYQNPEIEVYTK